LATCTSPEWHILDAVLHALRWSFRSASASAAWVPHDLLLGPLVQRGSLLEWYTWYWLLRSATVFTGWITGLVYASRTIPTRHIVDVVTRPAVGPGGPTSAVASWISVLPYASDTGPERHRRNKIGLRMVRPFLSASVAAGWIVFLPFAITTGPRRLVDAIAHDRLPGSLSPTSFSTGWIHAALFAAGCTDPQRLLLDAVLLYMLWPFGSASTCAR
jgi:hypothetical protein